MNKPENSVLVKFLKGHASDEESRIVESWIEESEENRVEFERLKSIWVSYDDRSSDFQPDMIEAWDKIQQRVNVDEKRRISPWFYRVAAILVLGPGITWLMVNRDNTTTGKLSSIDAMELFAQDNVKDVSLPDGTIVTLNKGASISYGSDFGSDDRRVVLQGEAFFDVKRDESSPFIIETESTRTEVLGTSFSISPTEESVVVTVVSGKVSFEGNGSGVILTKGEKGNYTTSSRSVSESTNDDLNFLSWKTKKLLFEDAPFSRVINDLEKYYEVEFEIGDTTVSRLTALFDNQSLEEVIEIISSTLDIKIEKSQEGSYLII